MPEIKSQSEALATIKTGLAANKNRFQQLIPGADDDEVKRFCQVAMTLFERTPALTACTTASLVGSVVEAAKLGLTLDPVLGHAYVIPYRDNRANTTRAVLIPGYRGLIELAMRSGQVAAIWADVVRKGDLCEQRQGTDPSLLHKAPPLEERDKTYIHKDHIVGAYACAKLTSGTVIHCLMSKAEIEAIKDKSPGKNSTPWLQHYAEMCKKTPVRRLCKMLSLSPVDMRAVVADEYFDAGLDPEPTEVEYEEKQATVLDDGVAPPADEPFALGGPITPKTLTELNSIMLAAGFAEEDVVQACEAAGGVDEPLHLSEDQAQEILRNLGHEAVPDQSGTADGLFP